MSLELIKLQNFWIQKIGKLKVRKAVSNDLLREPDWRKKLLSKTKLLEVDSYGQSIAEWVYDKATDNIAPIPNNQSDLLLDLPDDDNGWPAINDYQQIIFQNMVSFEEKFYYEKEQVKFFEELLGRFLKRICRYENDDRDFPPKVAMKNDPRAYFSHLKKNVLGKRGIGKILKSERRLKQRLEKRENQIKIACGLSLAANVPNDWQNRVNVMLDYLSNTLNYGLGALTIGDCLYAF